MRMEEYLNTVTEQIRCTRVREMISEELKDHILDQAEVYEVEGMFEEEAVEKAVRDMGDPVETGVSLDRIHRPQISVEILVLVGIISVLSIALHAVLGVYSQETEGAGYPYLRHHIVYVAAGYALMLLVYRLDYSILARFAKPAAAAFLGFVLIGTRFAVCTINGAKLYIRIGSLLFFMPVLMVLYVPLFGGLLYSYRGGGWKGLGKILLWALVPVWITFHIPAFSQGVVLWASLLLLTAAAVRRGWYRVCRGAALTVLGVLFAAPPALFLGAGALGRLASYQAARIQAFLTQSPDNNYLANQMRRILLGSRLIGGNAENVTEITGLPGFNSDYIFVSMISSYGVIAGVLTVALMCFLILKIFRVSCRQKNQLGMILGLSCGIVFLFQMGISVGMNLGLLPSTSAILPFFSAGGTGIVVSYILLGLVLSVYRYQNLLPADLQKAKDGQRRKRTDAAWQSRAAQM